MLTGFRSSPHYLTSVFFFCISFFLLSFVSVFGQGVSDQTSTEAQTQTLKTLSFSQYPLTNDTQPNLFQKSAPLFPKNGKPWEFEDGQKVQIKIQPSHILKIVTPYSFGCNIAWYDGKAWLLDPDRIEKAKESGIKYWRFPGGSSSDDYYWDGNYKDHQVDFDGLKTSRMNAVTSVSTDDFIDFCRQTGSEAVVTVNYAAARYADLATATNMASSWVKYFNIEKKFKVRYWEIGNESYGPWEQGNQIQGKPQLTGATYGSDFNVIADAMKKVDSDIQVGAVVYQEDGGDEWTGHNWWMKTLLPQVNGHADFWVLSGYLLWPFDPKTRRYVPPSNEELFGLMGKAPKYRDSIAQMVQEYSPGEKDIPVAISEYNTLTGATPPLIHLVGGLFTTEVLGEYIKADYPAACFWDWKNGFDPKLKGDFGMLSSGDPAVPDNTPRPSYYAFALYSRTFGSQMIETQSSDPKIKVYASLFKDGELGLVIVNENGENRTLELNLGSHPSKSRLVGWVLSGEDLDSSRVSWNGVFGPDGGGGPFPIDKILPYRKVFKDGEPLRINIAARSASGIILY